MQMAAFVEFIRASAGATPHEVAAELGVGARTVRGYVRQANQAMHGLARIRLSRIHGYYLSVNDEEQFEDWLRSVPDGREAVMPQTPRERKVYLLNDLLMRDGWITLDRLSEILAVSRSSVSRDIKDVEATLNRFELVLEKRPHYGIRVKGPEMARRLCLANLIMEDAQTPAAHVRANAALLSGRVRPGGVSYAELLDAIVACMEAVSDEASYTINSIAYQNLLVHIAVALVRIQENRYVSMDGTHLERMRDAREFALSRRMAALLAERTGIELPEDEVAYIAIHLAGNQTIPVPAEGEEGLVISNEVWGIVSRMLERTWRMFRFDFRDDIELRMNLARHIMPLAVRLSFNMSLQNPLTPDIKTRYPLAYSMAVDAGAVIEEHWGNPLTDDETGYIALAYALALERQKTEAPRKNILVVCASGAGSARLLEHRCRQEFGAFVGDIRACDVLDVDKVDFDAIDYVFTTVPIDRPLPVPICEVPYFLDDADIERVRGVLRGDESSAWVLRYFDPELFFPHLACESKEEVLDCLIGHVARTRDVDASFSHLVWERERALPTCFGNGVAMPHPLEAAGAQTFMCVGLLDTPVAWDDSGRTVRAVFLSSFSSEPDEGVQYLYAVLAGLLMSETAIDTLMREQTWDALSDLLATFEAGCIPAGAIAP